MFPCANKAVSDGILNSIPNLLYYPPNAEGLVCQSNDKLLLLHLACLIIWFIGEIPRNPNCKWPCVIICIQLSCCVQVSGADKSFWIAVPCVPRSAQSYIWCRLMDDKDRKTGCNIHKSSGCCSSDTEAPSLLYMRNTPSGFSALSVITRPLTSQPWPSCTSRGCCTFSERVPNVKEQPRRFDCKCLVLVKAYVAHNPDRLVP